LDFRRESKPIPLVYQNTIAKNEKKRIKEKGRRKKKKRREKILYDWLRFCRTFFVFAMSALFQVSHTNV